MDDNKFDPYLIFLMHAAEVHAANTPVLLIVRGMKVFGTIISGQEFHNAFIGGLLNQDAEEALRKNLTAVMSEALANRGFKLDVENYSFQFLHLRDVTIMSDSKPITIDFWRCSLASVDGFYMGNYPKGM